MKNVLKINGLFFFWLLTTALWAQKETPIEAPAQLVSKGDTLKGTLLIPSSKKPVPVALIIAGSGPTDRNGNQTFGSNNSLKMVAEALAAEGIASLRYDKRGIAGSKSANMVEQDMRFETFVNDAADWLRQLKGDSRFNHVVVIGHSEGSLIGMIAARQEHADAFISLAGAGRRADEVIKEQLFTQSEEVADIAYPIIDSLVAGKTVDHFDPMFDALFRSSVQPYLISWFRYDPRKEIAKLNVPVLIVQGLNDLQVSKQDALNLKEASADAQLVFIEDMNHILKIVKGGARENIASYQNPDLPLAEDCARAIIKFLGKLKK